MRAAIVVELPDMPEDDPSVLAEMMADVGRALNVPGLRERLKLFITIRESAEAVLLAAAEPPPERVRR